jgi:protein-S-isoprenylcysteine O-methyltransferase Ste14
MAGWAATRHAVSLVPDSSSPGRKLRANLLMAIIGLGLAALLAVLLWIPFPLDLTPQVEVALDISALLLFAVGIGLTLWARRAFGAMWGISTGGSVVLLPEHRLTQDGPYSPVRHPMYLGWWVALLGILLIYRTWFVAMLLFVSLVVFARRARLEERVLAERFGPAWEEYARRTQSLIPFVC